MSASDSIDQLKSEAAAAIASNEAESSRKIMNVVIAYGPAVIECSERRAYDDGEKLLTEWKLFLDENDKYLNPDAKLLARGRLSSSSGYFWEGKASYEYYMEQDYIRSPILFERAEALHEEALDLLEKVEIIPDAPPEFLQQRLQTLANQRAEIFRARGMKLLTQGQYEVETLSLVRGQQLLTQAIKDLTAAEKISDNPSESGNKANRPSSPHFIDYSKSILWEAKSDQALLEGKLKVAAEGQNKRAEALERCRAMHAHFGDPVNQYFARRMARDAHVARHRHDRLESAATALPSFGWLKPSIFLIVAILTAGGAVFWAPTTVIGSVPSLSLLLLYALVVAGIGSKLIQWREGANIFIKAISKTAGNDGEKTVEREGNS